MSDSLEINPTYISDIHLSANKDRILLLLLSRLYQCSSKVSFQYSVIWFFSYRNMNWQVIAWKPFQELEFNYIYAVFVLKLATIGFVSAPALVVDILHC